MNPPLPTVALQRAMLSHLQTVDANMLTDLWKLVIGFVIPVQEWVIGGGAAEVTHVLSPHEFEFICPAKGDQSQVYASWTSVLGKYCLQIGESVTIGIQLTPGGSTLGQWYTDRMAHFHVGVVDTHTRWNPNPSGKYAALDASNPKVNMNNTDYLEVCSRRDKTTVRQRGTLSDVRPHVEDDCGNVISDDWPCPPNIGRMQIMSVQFRHCDHGDGPRIYATMYAGATVVCSGALSSTDKQVRPFVSVYYYKNRKPEGWKFDIATC